MRRHLPAIAAALAAALIVSAPALASLAQEFGDGDSTVNGNLTVSGTSTTTGADTAASYTATSSGQFNCSSTTATCKLQSTVADATTSATVGAITLKSGADITSTDLLLDVQDSSGNHAFKCTEAGSCTTLSSFSATSISSTTGSISVPTGVAFSTNGSGGQSGIISTATTDIVMFTNNGGAGNAVSLSAGVLYPYSAGMVALGNTANPWSDIAGDASMRGTCTLDGASPSKCTATVTAAAICVCSPVGTTAAIAAGGCATSLSGTTLTLTSANGLTNDVKYHCIL